MCPWKTWKDVDVSVERARSLASPGDAIRGIHAVANPVAYRRVRVGVRECASRRRGGGCMCRWIGGLTWTLLDV